MIAEGINPASLEQLRITQQEALQRRGYDTPEAKRVFEEAANPYTPLGSVVYTFGTENFLAQFNSYSDTRREVDQARAKTDQGSQGQEVLHNAEQRLESFLDRTTADYAGRIGMDQSQPNKEEMEDLKRTVQEVFGSAYTSIGPGDDFESKRQYFSEALDQYMSTEQQIRSSTDTYYYLTNKAKNYTSSLTNQALDQRKRELRGIDGILWDGIRTSFRPEDRVDYEKLGKKPPDQLDDFDRTLLAAHKNEALGGPGRDTVISLYGEGLDRLAGTDTLKQPGMLDKAASTIRELVNIGLAKIGRWDTRASSQLSVAVELMKAYSVHEPDFDPYKAGLPEAYMHLVDGVAAMDVDSENHPDWPYSHPEKGAGLSTLYGLLKQLDEIRVIEMIPQTIVALTPNAPAAGSVEMPGDHTEIHDPGVVGVETVPSPTDIEGTGIERDQPHDEKLDSFTASLGNPELINTSTATTLRKMFNPEDRSSQHYYYDASINEFRAPEQTVKMVMQDVLDLKNGVLTKGDTAKRIAEIVYDSCIGEDGTFSDRRFKAEVFMLFRALEYLYPARENKGEFQLRLQTVVRTQDEAQEILRHANKRSVNG